LIRNNPNDYAIHSYWILTHNELKFLCNLQPYKLVERKISQLLEIENYVSAEALQSLIFKKMIDYKNDKIILQNFLNFLLRQLTESNVDEFELNKPIACSKCTIVIQTYLHQKNCFKIAITPREVT
jgi:hypothetical protein